MTMSHTPANPTPLSDQRTDQQQTEKPRRGRPPVLDAKQRQRIVQLLDAGCSRRTAALTVGCASTTITRTALRDPEFATKIAHAESNLESQLLQKVHNAASKGRYWRAASWILERKFPHDYARRPPHLFTADEVLDFFVAATDTLEEALTANQYEQILKKLDTFFVPDRAMEDPGETPTLLDSKQQVTYPDH